MAAGARAAGGGLGGAGGGFRLPGSCQEASLAWWMTSSTLGIASDSGGWGGSGGWVIAVDYLRRHSRLRPC